MQYYHAVCFSCFKMNGLVSVRLQKNHESLFFKLSYAKLKWLVGPLTVRRSACKNQMNLKMNQKRAVQPLKDLF